MLNVYKSVLNSYFYFFLFHIVCFMIDQFFALIFEI